MIKKYDDDKEFNYIDSLLKSENGYLNKPVSSELFAEMIRSTIASYTKNEKKIKLNFMKRYDKSRLCFFKMNSLLF